MVEEISAETSEPTLGLAGAAARASRRCSSAPSWFHVNSRRIRTEIIRIHRVPIAIFRPIGRPAHFRSLKVQSPCGEKFQSVSEEGGFPGAVGDAGTVSPFHLEGTGHSLVAAVLPLSRRTLDRTI
jgi:hypothetical protein